MSDYTLEDIQDMLDELPGKKWTFALVKEDALTKTGALRTVEGQNIIEPGPETASMVVGLRASIDFLAAAPEIVQQLLDTIAQNDRAVTEVPPPAKPEKVANKPISA